MSRDPTGEAGAKPRGLLPGIQLLRGCAAALVVLAHANGMMGHPPYFGVDPYQMPDVGGFGVTVFFTISGFIIAIVSLDHAWQPTMTVNEYARRRFTRIVPFLWLCTIGYNIFTYIGTREMDWASMLRALVIWPVGELKPNVLWSLRHEFLFYVLFALTMMGGRRHLGLLVAWFVTPLVLWTVLLPFPYQTTPWHPYNIELLKVVFFGSESAANLQLGVGFLLGMLWLKGTKALGEWLPGGLTLCLILSIIGAAIVTYVPFPPGLARTLLWTALAAVIVTTGLVAQGSDSFLRRAGVQLGNGSFSIYLVHNPILLILLELSKGRTEMMAPMPFLVIFTLVAIAGGMAVHYLVERPLIAALSGKKRFFLRGIRAKTQP
ncbi:acyltransferase family protein [Sphingomonas sp. ID0503]|uniref:acyltransferase family protein n=1 Tax=Sphingomonas sp. ID0503 TaxID=3399691 RepID=UPI003AFAD871